MDEKLNISNFAKIRRILPRRLKIQFLFIFVGIILGAQIEMLTLAVIQPFIMILTDNSIIYTNNIIYLVYSLFGFTDTASFLAFLSFVIAFVFTFRGLYVYFFSVIHNRIIAQGTAQISTSLLIKTFKRPYLFHTDSSVVSIQATIIRSTEKFFSLIGGFMSICIDGFMSLSILGLLIVSSPSMTLVILFLASICIVIYFKILKAKLVKSGEEEERGLNAINKSVTQALHGIKEIKVMQKEDFFTRKFKKVNDTTIAFRARMMTLKQLPKLFIESLCFSGVFVVLAFTIYVGVDVESLLPVIGIFVLAAFKLLPAISRFVTNITTLLRQINSINTVFQGLFYDDILYETKLPEPEIDNVTKDIVVQNVTFSYARSKKPVLLNVSLTIPYNKSVAFIGKSGAGKSTLVDILLGVLSPDEGNVVYNGKSIHHRFEEWTAQIGYVPQSIYLLDESIISNVAFGVDEGDIDEDKVWQALERANMKEFTESLPEGIYTMVGERGVRLSGGQRQRIGIARALYSDPPILVLDEATSSLDVETEAAVMKAIQDVKETKTIIIVAHRLSTIEKCDIVYEVNRGKVKIKK